MADDPTRVYALPEFYRRRITVRADGCWLWSGRIANGYGVVSVIRPDGEDSTEAAHRQVAALLEFPLGENMHHLCEAKSCVNPSHLQPMSISEHASHHGLRTHCVHGHEFTPENTYQRLDDGTKQCRRCAADRAGARRRRDPQKDAQAHELDRRQAKVTRRSHYIGKRFGRFGIVVTVEAVHLDGSVHLSNGTDYPIEALTRWWQQLDD